MQTKTNQIPRIEKITKIWSPDSKLWIPHNDGEIAFASPSFGSDNYTNIGKEILNHNLKIATGEHTASLLHAVYCGPEEFKDSLEAQTIRKIMKDKWPWVFNRNLWTSEGVYVIQDSEAKGIEKLNQKDLEEKLSNSSAGSPILYNSDKTIRFAPKGSYQLGEHTSESLAKDGFIIASYGTEGAEKLAEISTKFKESPYVYGVEVEKGKDPIQRVASLSSDWYDDRLVVYGNNHVLNDYGCAFGVLKEVAKPLAPKN